MILSFLHGSKNNTIKGGILCKLRIQNNLSKEVAAQLGI